MVSIRTSSDSPRPSSIGYGLEAVCPALLKVSQESQASFCDPLSETRPKPRREPQVFGTPPLLAQVLYGCTIMSRLRGVVDIISASMPVFLLASRLSHRIGGEDFDVDGSQRVEGCAVMGWRMGGGWGMRSGLKMHRVNAGTYPWRYSEVRRHETLYVCSNVARCRRWNATRVGLTGVGSQAQAMMLHVKSVKSGAGL